MYDCLFCFDVFYDRISVRAHITGVLLILMSAINFIVIPYSVKVSRV